LEIEKKLFVSQKNVKKIFNSVPNIRKNYIYEYVIRYYLRDFIAEKLKELSGGNIIFETDKYSVIPEKIIFNKVSTGALSDLEKVTKQATAMIVIYGLNEKVGNISYYDPQSNGFTKPYSEATARIIDEEVKGIIEGQYQRAIKILQDNRDKLTQLAELLLQKEVIFKEDLERIFGKRPFGTDGETIHIVPKVSNSIPEVPPINPVDTPPSTNENPVVEPTDDNV
jgi:hypothetical protein